MVYIDHNFPNTEKPITTPLINCLPSSPQNSWMLPEPMGPPKAEVTYKPIDPLVSIANQILKLTYRELSELGNLICDEVEDVGENESIVITKLLLTVADKITQRNL